MGDIFDEAPTDGKCRGYDTNMWFPIFSKSPSKAERNEINKQIEIARTICGQCSQSEHCLEYSLRHEPLGIWGGKTELERANIRNSRGIVVSREGRIFFPGIGLRSTNADTSTYRAKIVVDD
jgi:WhiB family redox-sensing transcriptional regulator